MASETSARAPRFRYRDSLAFGEQFPGRRQQGLASAFLLIGSSREITGAVCVIAHSRIRS